MLPGFILTRQTNIHSAFREGSVNWLEQDLTYLKLNFNLLKSKLNTCISTYFILKYI